MAISTVVAVGDAGDALREQIRKRIARLKVGPGLDPNAEMGPLVAPEAKGRVLSYVEAGIREGADLAVDGRGELPEQGFFVGRVSSTT